MFARYWNAQDPFEKMERRAQRCAEVLVPDRIPTEYLMGVYVSNEKTKKRVEQEVAGIDARVEPDRFFQ